MANMANKKRPKRPAGHSAGKTDNDHQKVVSGKNQKGPMNKLGKDAGGNRGSRGQNRRTGSGSATSVGSHRPEGDGPGTKKFKHESDPPRRGEDR